MAAGTGPCDKCGENTEPLRYIRHGRELCWGCFAGETDWIVTTYGDETLNPYASLVRRVWEGIERETGYPPCPLSNNILGAFCPVAGCDGTLAITFLDVAPPTAVITENVAIGGRTGCSRGCSAQQILEALLR